MVVVVTNSQSRQDVDDNGYSWNDSEKYDNIAFLQETEKSKLQHDLDGLKNLFIFLQKVSGEGWD